MADGMKSALELALERTEHVRKTIHEEGLMLTDSQRDRLAALEREYSAKIAEKDVMLQSEIRKVLMHYPPAEAGALLEQLRQKFVDEKRKLMEEKDTKVTQIRHPGNAEGNPHK